MKKRKNANEGPKPCKHGAVPATSCSECATERDLARYDAMEPAFVAMREALCDCLTALTLTAPLVESEAIPYAIIKGQAALALAGKVKP